MPKWIKGQSGNPRGRPKNQTAIAELACSQVGKHKLVQKLGSIAGREGEYADVNVDQQLRAIQLLLAYGYGPPRAALEGGDGIVIQVNYVERNQIAVNGASSGAITGDPGGQAVQRGLLRAPLGQDGAGDGSADPSGIGGQAGSLVCAELPPAV